MLISRCSSCLLASLGTFGMQLMEQNTLLQVSGFLSHFVFVFDVTKYITIGGSISVLFYLFLRQNPRFSLHCDSGRYQSNYWISPLFSRGMEITMKISMKITMKITMKIIMKITITENLHQNHIKIVLLFNLLITITCECINPKILLFLFLMVSGDHQMVIVVIIIIVIIMVIVIVIVIVIVVVIVVIIMVIVRLSCFSIF